MNKELYWIWLSVAAGPGTSLPQRLINRFGADPEIIYNATKEDYSGLKASPGQLNALCDKSLEFSKDILNWCKEHKVNILCYDDSKYPKRLRAIPDPPIVLYYIGELYDIDSQVCLAGVGTRRMTRYGRDCAYTFSYDLARSGVIVVSGLAAGIDTVCHRAALDAGGRTISVIGCRINKVYPSENRDIMREIARKGLLITEFHPFSKTAPSNFPKRNRIISGLCQGTIVFEADSASGSLITASHAIKQGRKLYSLPGRIGEDGALGTNELIRENGATLVSRVTDILEEYTELYDLNPKLSPFDYSPARVNKDSYRKKNEASVIKFEQDIDVNRVQSTEQKIKADIKDPVQKRIYDALSYDTPISLEELIMPNTDISEIMSAITMLEISGYITVNPGNTYTKNN